MVVCRPLRQMYYRPRPNFGRLKVEQSRERVSEGGFGATVRQPMSEHRGGIRGERRPVRIDRPAAPAASQAERFSLDTARNGRGRGTLLILDDPTGGPLRN